MSLPPAFLDELRTRLSLGQVVGRKVTWDPRKTNQGKGDLWAPCPFHQEKTASFHVDDRKGFYYCFGCHAKGDAISFVRETENVGFMEAIEILAREAGMPMPESDPHAQAKADRRGQLAEVMEVAVQHYRLQLNTAAAAVARDYLAGRKLAPKALERFEIGFAPDARQGLFQALTGKGIDAERLVDAGLCARPDDGGVPYDRFRDRIIYPIRDARGRCIALGGRAMAADARAKYLNSPETELFDKGRSLYNLAPAREAAGNGQALVVAEGYMDVIALVTAGFEAAVAPLGTAVTEDQLRLLWRMHPEPIVALDGDKAGLHAALRLIDLALPLIEAGQSLRFAMMPEGRDPDDVIREGGPQAMQALIDRAEPMVTLLWRRETEGRVFDSPERRATLDRSLRVALKRIADPSLRRHYGDEINRLRHELFGTGRGPAGGRRPWSKTWTPRRAPPPEPLAATRASLLGAAGAVAVEEPLREAVILATLLAHPDLLHEFESPLEDLDCADPDLASLRAALIRHADAGPEFAAEVAREVGAAVLEKLRSMGHVRIAPALRHDGDVDVARLCLAGDFARLTALRGARREVAEAVADFDDLSDEGLTWRLRQAAEATERAGKSQSEDRTEYEVAPNGLRLSRSERGAFDDLVARIGQAASLTLSAPGEDAAPEPDLGEEKVKK